jgi:hypothetical protein
MNDRAESWHTKAESNPVSRKGWLYTILLMTRKVEVRAFDVPNAKQSTWKTKSNGRTHGSITGVLGRLGD